MRKVLLAIALVSSGIAQTRIAEEQMRLKVRVVEWQKCVWESPEKALSSEGEPIPTAPLQSCVGLQLFRFLMSDGSIVGPYIGTLAPADYKHDPSKWESVSTQ